MYNIITKNDFSFKEDIEGITVIKLETGDFAGVEYQYKKVEIREEGDVGVLSFNYNIVNDDGKDLTTNDFTDYIGDVLTFVITDALDDDSFYIGKPDGSIDSNNDSQESTQ